MGDQGAIFKPPTAGKQEEVPSIVIQVLSAVTEGCTRKEHPQRLSTPPTVSGMISQDDDTEALSGRTERRFSWLNRLQVARAISGSSYLQGKEVSGKRVR